MIILGVFLLVVFGLLLFALNKTLNVMAALTEWFLMALIFYMVIVIVVIGFEMILRWFK